METLTGFQARIASQAGFTPQKQNSEVQKQPKELKDAQKTQEPKVTIELKSDMQPIYGKDKVSVYDPKPPVQKIEISIKNENDSKSDALKAPIDTEIKKEGKYVDPLMKWPVRGLAYTNEVGAAISGIAPTAGTLLWIPALLYIGADTYDKYKNDGEKYNPSVERGAQEAIFQTCASVVMPTGAVKAGQRIVSSLTRYSDEGLSALAKENVLEHSLAYFQTHDMGDFSGDVAACKKELSDSVLNAAQNAKNKYDGQNIFKKVLSFINPFNDPDNIAKANREKLGEYASNQAEKMMEMGRTLMQDKKPEGMSDKLFKKFQTLKVDFKNTDPSNYMEKATKSILVDQHNAQIFKNKLMKTVGGFVALGLLIKPIDLFVEKYIIKKTVEPGMDYIQDRWQKSPYYKGKAKQEAPKADNNK